MKKFNDHYIDCLNPEEVLFIFFDESGTYKNSEINKSINEYRKKGVISNGRDNFNISAIAIPRDKYIKLSSDINKVKANSGINHDKYMHRTDYSYRNFTEREDQPYIHCMDYFQDISALIKAYKLPTYSIGYNFKSLPRGDYKNIYIQSLKN